MKEVLTFDDTLIVPKFSTVKSRKDVDISTLICGHKLNLPVISSNMDTVTESAMAKAMNTGGGVGCLHRFMSIEDNIKMFQESEVKPWVSYGLGTKELERVEALFQLGAQTFVLDVAHGANSEVVNQMKEVLNLVGYGRANFVVGNFGDAYEVFAFSSRLGKRVTYKVGIGGGSACTTRIETGCGYPTLGAVLSCKKSQLDIIADGGIRTPGDVAKCLAAGAKAVMLGGMLAGTEESPGEVIYPEGPGPQRPVKSYRGSASQESYMVQGKDESWRTAEGESFTIPYKGSVNQVLQRIEGGLRSAYSYVGANNTEEFQEFAEFIKITNAGIKESGAHGKQ